MTPGPIDAYVQRLRRELRRHFIADARILDEVRDHLVDAVERSRERNESVEAEAEAIARFGSPEVVAATFAADRTQVLHQWLLAAAMVAGSAIALVDALPSWDDTGITAGAMAIVASVFGLLAPQRPWRWALAVGLWIPAYSLARTPALATLPMLLVVIFPLAGAYAGRAARGLFMVASRSVPS
jgi:hypothetical protein